MIAVKLYIFQLFLDPFIELVELGIRTLCLLVEVVGVCQQLPDHLDHLEVLYIHDVRYKQQSKELFLELLRNDTEDRLAASACHGAQCAPVIVFQTDLLIIQVTNELHLGVRSQRFQRQELLLEGIEQELPVGVGR